MNTSSSENSIKKNMEEDLERRTFRARQHVKKLTNEGKKELIDTIINKHQGEGTSPSEELEYYFGNDIRDELAAHNNKMSEKSGISPMIPINYGRQNGRQNGGKKGKTQRKNKKSKKSKTQRKIKKTKKSKTRKSTRRRR